MMNRMNRMFAFGSATLLAAVAFSACGDDKGDPATTDTSVNTDTTTPADVTVEPDTSVTPDTSTPDTSTPTEACTETERDTFGTCAEGCGQDQQCFAGCVNALSPTCGAAFDALAACIQTNGCNQANFETCVTQNCLDEYEDFYGPPPEPTACNPVTSAECEAGETCTYVTQEFDVGCATAGTAEIGEACGGQVGCKSGACLGDGTSSVCTPFCSPNNNTCPNNAPCNVSVQGSDFVHCGSPPDGCDVFAQDCTNNRGCYPINQAGDTTCAANSGKAQGATCAAINDCGAGLICVGSGASGTCQTICDLEKTEGACAAGTCTAAGFTRIGFCQL